ncbi:unnamed protein product [Caenorhabditis angaria]|uniref:MATH domain-containing protein n=1 Tax=Caenorhabditis angaria TaxID=860376 RepID=A0A9P1J1B9_9PELO|nr:unnamed protein product [Caenorhabditis angaria]
MQTKSTEDACASEPPTPPDLYDGEEHEGNEEAGHSAGGQSSGLSDEAGQSSGGHLAGDDEGHSSHSGSGRSGSAGVGEGEGSTMSNADSSTHESTRGPSKVLCQIHQQKIGMRRRMMNTVACQTDETQDFGPLLVDPSSVDDPSCSEGTLRLMIQNFRNMGDTVRGPTKRIQNVSWRIMVMPRQHVVQKKGTQKCLGFFLQCCPEAYSDSWSCQAAAELRLISQKPGVPHFTRKTNHIYTAKENDWGYSCFMTWADILDESQGYIKDDRVVLEVTVKADPPKNIVGIDEFRKTVQSWVDLAEMQFKRGKIDLAIEANSQGLKFCKDKDADCRRKLEEQKRTFIEKKLAESIQRIETQKKETTEECDVVSNQTALRMALTANNHSKNKNNKNKKKNAKPRAPTPNNQQKVTTNTAVKTESAKTVSQNQQVKQKQQQKVTGKKDSKNNSFEERRSRQQVSAKKIDGDFEFTGNFNQRIFNGRSPLTWTRRSKAEDDFISDAASYFSEDTEMSSHERDSFVMKYMTDQMRAVNYPEVKDGKKKILYNMAQLRNFAESAFEVEMQRQTIIKKAVIDAYDFMKRAATQPDVDDPAFVMMEWDVATLWENDRAESRASIIDREANFLDAKIRLFWDALGGMEKFLESDSSDHDSISSTESSDRQNDGCLKPKRTRLDMVCECCVNEKTSPSMCDSEVQTEETAKNASPILKDGKSQTQKATQKTNQKAQNNKQAQTQKQADAPQFEQSQPPSPNPESLHPPGFPPPVIPTFNFGEFGGPDSNQVINALSTVAMNLMNTRRIINKAEEFMIIIAKNQADENLRGALRDISKVAGIAYIENEEKYRPDSPLLTEDFGEDDFASLYAKLMNEENKEMIVMTKQVEKFDQYKNHLKQHLFLDQDDVDRLIKGAHAVNAKIADYERKLKDFQKNERRSRNET